MSQVTITAGETVVETTTEAIGLAVSMAGAIGGNAQGKLLSLVERIERLEEDKAAIATDMKEVYAGGEGRGLRRQDHPQGRPAARHGCRQAPGRRGADRTLHHRDWWPVSRVSGTLGTGFRPEPAPGSREHLYALKRQRWSVGFRTFIRGGRLIMRVEPTPAEPIDVNHNGEERP